MDGGFLEVTVLEVNALATSPNTSVSTLGDQALTITDFVVVVLLGL